MTRWESSKYPASVAVTAMLATLGCGSPPAAAEPAPPAGAVTVPEPEASEPTPPATGAESPDGTTRRTLDMVQPALAASIEDGYADHLLERIKVPRDAEARAEPGGEPPSAPSKMEYRETLVVAQAPTEKVAEVRSVVDTKALRVLVWFHPSQLFSVMTAKAHLAKSAKRAATGKIGVTVHPGLRVSARAEQGDRVQVEAEFEFASPDSGLVTVKGWVDKNKVAQVYLPSPPVAQTFPNSKPFFVDKATEVLTAPGGASVAHVGEGGGGVFFPVKVLSERGKVREIYFVGEEIEVRGFVSESVLEDLEPERARGWGRGFASAKLWQRWPKEQVRIPRGTCIYDRTGAEAIGVFKREHVENVVIPSEDSPYRAYRLPYDAVGHLYASDLIPVRKGETEPASKQTLDLGAGTWTCPKRAD